MNVLYPSVWTSHFLKSKPIGAPMEDDDDPYKPNIVCSLSCESNTGFHNLRTRSKGPAWWTARRTSGDWRPCCSHAGPCASETVDRQREASAFMRESCNGRAAEY